MTSSDVTVAAPFECHDDQKGEIGESQELEKNAPIACTPLLFQRSKRQFFQDFALQGNNSVPSKIIEERSIQRINRRQ